MCLNGSLAKTWHRSVNTSIIYRFDRAKLIVSVMIAVELTLQLIVALLTTALFSSFRTVVSYGRLLCTQVATLVAGFLTKLRQSITDEQFLRQLWKVGVLAEFEGLLSCHGDEIGMIEDMMVAVQDLSSVSFRLEESSSVESDLPRIIPSR